MVNFSRYYVDFLQQLLGNFLDLVKSIFNAIIKFFGTDVKGYFDTLIAYSNNFKILDWIVYVLVFLINIGLIVLLVILIVYVAKRRKRFKKKQFEKEELLEEIETLNYKIEELITEKNQIFAMKHRHTRKILERAVNQIEIVARTANARVGVKSRQHRVSIALRRCFCGRKAKH